MISGKKERETKLTTRAKKRVRTRLAKYDTVNGSRSDENKCFKWAIGPDKIENPIMNNIWEGGGGAHRPPP